MRLSLPLFPNKTTPPGPVAAFVGASAGGASARGVYHLSQGWVRGRFSSAGEGGIFWGGFWFWFLVFWFFGLEKGVVRWAVRGLLGGGVWGWVWFVRNVFDI